MSLYLQWWAGLFLAAIPLALGILLFFVARRYSRRNRFTLNLLAYLGLGVGAILMSGALIAIRHRAIVWKSHPPAGQLVDVGGYRIHLMGEGSRTTKPTLVWISGGYGAGLWMQPLHERFRNEYRSCLFDRAGSGWSDVGPVPRTQDRLADELRSALAAAAEQPPFVIIGHSAGGLQAAHFAHRFPNLVAGVVVLDGSSPLHLAIEGRRYWGRPTWFSDAYVWATLFGSDVLFPHLHPLKAPGSQPRSLKTDTWNLLVEFEARPSALASSNLLSDSDNRACFDMVRGEHILGDIPLLALMQPDRSNDPQVQKQAREFFQLTDDEVRVWKCYHQSVHREYPNMSRRGKLVEIPAKMTHQFPLEEPDFTAEQIREFLTTLP